jgi:hypothetical protein
LYFAFFTSLSECLLIGKKQLTMGNSKGKHLLLEMENAHVWPTTEDIKRLFSSYDTSKDGLLQKSETSKFLKGWLQLLSCEYTSVRYT